MPCFARPLEFEDGTPIIRAEPWQSGSEKAWIVFADSIPEPWDPTCANPLGGTVITPEGFVMGFDRLPKVRNR